MPAYPSLTVGWAVEHPSRPFARDLFVPHREFAIDHHVADTHRVLMRLLILRAVTDRIRIEHHQVRFHSRAYQPAILNLEPLRRESSHAAHAFFKSKNLLLTHVDTQNASERSVAARMRRFLPEDRNLAVRGDHRIG